MYKNIYTNIAVSYMYNPKDSEIKDAALVKNKNTTSLIQK